MKTFQPYNPDREYILRPVKSSRKSEELQTKERKVVEFECGKQTGLCMDLPTRDYRDAEYTADYREFLDGIYKDIDSNHQRKEMWIK